MNEPLSDKQLKTEFRQLRETEMQATPGYHATPASARPATTGNSFKPAMQIVIATGVLVVMMTSFLHTSRDQSLPDSPEVALPLPQEEDRIVNMEMPTDFLLDTPWFDLARTTPDFDFEFPHYDLPEERSDET